MTRSTGDAILWPSLASLARWFVLVCCAMAAACRQPVDQQSPATNSAQIITTSTGFELVRIPAGRFTMGGEAGQPDEAPAHEVQLAAFLIDRFEATQKLFAKVSAGEPRLASDPSHFKGPDRPAEMVSWADAALFCNQRSRLEGLTPCYNEETAECDFAANGYRLPTEAEWEYACRAGGAISPQIGGDPRELGRSGWFQANSSRQTHPVGAKKPNPWGLFDMQGNVAEWCNDIYDPTYYQTSPAENPRGPGEGEKYVLRGGSWNSDAEACRPSRRAGVDPGIQDACFARNHVGFRCVRRAPDQP